MRKPCPVLPAETGSVVEMGVSQSSSLPDILKALGREVLLIPAEPFPLQAGTVGFC